MGKSNVLLKNNSSIDKMTECLEEPNVDWWCGTSLEAGQRSVITANISIELPLRDDDDDPWPGRCLVAYKLLLVLAFSQSCYLVLHLAMENIKSLLVANRGEIAVRLIGPTGKWNPYTDMPPRYESSRQQNSLASRQYLCTQEQT